MTPNNLDIPDQDNWEQDEAPPANYYRAGAPNAPTAGFQTLWVQRQLKKLKERTEALRAQYIKPDDII